jgi:RNA polymerase sigma factor (TIGR02999 family)
MTDLRTLGDVTHMLAAFGAGQRDVEDALLARIYPELRRIAARELSFERSGHVSIQVTELVHELYVKLVSGRQPSWQDRAHFFAVATRVIRRILVDRARQRQSQKRGGSTIRIPLDSATEEPAESQPEPELLALDEALRELASRHQTAARVVELRYFGGLTIDEIAHVLELGSATVQRRWRFARAWLAEAMATRRADE